MIHHFSWTLMEKWKTENVTKIFNKCRRSRNAFCKPWMECSLVRKSQLILWNDWTGQQGSRRLRFRENKKEQTDWMTNICKFCWVIVWLFKTKTQLIIALNCLTIRKRKFSVRKFLNSCICLCCYAWAISCIRNEYILLHICNKKNLTKRNLKQKHKSALLTYLWSWLWLDIQLLLHCNI